MGRPISLTAVLLCVSFPLFPQDSQVIDVNPKEGGLGDTIDVKIQNLSSPPGGGTQMLPFLNGHALKGSTVEYVNPATQEIRFILKRDAADKDSKEAWNHVLSGLGPAVRSFPISIGPKDGPPIPISPTVPPFKLVVFPQPWSAIALITIVVLLIIFVVLAIKTDMLKDLPHDPNAPEKRTYSLGRCQMAWWFFIILVSFTTIWLITGELTFPDSSLVLLGISGATGLSAIIIKPRPDKGPPQRFFEDILNSGDGIGFHRFQIIGWTLILGIIFIVKVINELAQPTFDATVLTLMGISSGTYIGFKFPEKPKM